MDVEIPMNVGTLRRGETHVEFVDQYGDKRVIHRLKGQKLAVKRQGNTPAHALNRAAARLIGQNIRVARLEAGLSMEELCRRAGLAAAPGCGKHRIYEIEQSTRGEGIRMGTLFAIAIALNVPAASLIPTNEEVACLAGVSFETSEGLAV